VEEWHIPSVQLSSSFLNPRIVADVECSVVVQSVFARFFWECATPPHLQVCHCMRLSFTRPSSALVLQVTNTGVWRPGYETSLPLCYCEQQTLGWEGLGTRLGEGPVDNKDPIRWHHTRLCTSEGYSIKKSRCDIFSASLPAGHGTKPWRQDQHLTEEELLGSSFLTHRLFSHLMKTFVYKIKSVQSCLHGHLFHCSFSRWDYTIPTGRREVPNNEVHALKLHPDVRMDHIPW